MNGGEPTYTLLVIDDQLTVRKPLGLILAKFGITVVDCESGKEGLALFDQQFFDGALVDLHMPGLNGIEVCIELRTRALKQGRDFPVWLMTGAVTTEARRLATAAEILAVYSKPFDFPQLAHDLRQQFGKK